MGAELIDRASIYHMGQTKKEEEFDRKRKEPKKEFERLNSVQTSFFIQVDSKCVFVEVELRPIGAQTQQCGPKL